jgi:hypothetical protein
MLLQRPLTRLVIRPAVHQAAKKRREVRRQDGRRVVLGLDVDDARLTQRPADAVVEHDCVVPGRRGPADDDPDVRQPGLGDQAPRAELLGIDPPPPADAEDCDDAGRDCPTSECRRPASTGIGDSRRSLPGAVAGMMRATRSPVSFRRRRPSRRSTLARCSGLRRRRHPTNRRRLPCVAPVT